MPGTAAGATVPGTLSPPKPANSLLSVWPVGSVPVVVRSPRQAASRRSAPGIVSCVMPRQLGGALPGGVDAWAAVPLGEPTIVVAMTAAAQAAPVTDLGKFVMGSLLGCGRVCRGHRTWVGTGANVGRVGDAREPART